jgi:hypothetical protein
MTFLPAHAFSNVLSLSFACERNRGADFCGYSVPHPSEPKMNIRVQAKARMYSFSLCFPLCCSIDEWGCGVQLVQQLICFVKD